MRTPVALGGLSGLFILFLLNLFLNGIFALVSLSLILILLILSLVFLKGKHRKKAAAVCLFCILPVISFCYFYFFKFVPDTALYSKEITVTGIVTENNGNTYILKPSSAYLNNKKIKIHGNIKITNYNSSDVKFYDIITCNLKIRDKKAPSPFDFSMQDRAKGIYLSAVLKEETKTGHFDVKDLNYYSNKLREAVNRAINVYIKTDNKGIASAVTTGDKANLTRDASDGFMLSGLMHLTAVSGTHFVFMLGFFLFLFDILSVNRRYSYTICIIIGAFICLSAGFTPSVMRAFLVTAIMYVGYILKKETEPLNSLMVAGLIITLVNPFAAGGLSFLLSFLAAMGIITTSTPLSLFLEEKLFSKLKGNLWLLRFNLGIICSTVAATAFTLPLIAYCFIYVPAAGVFCNILIVPVASFLPVLVFLMLIFSFFPVIGGVLGFASGFICDYIALVFKLVVRLDSPLIFTDKPYFYMASALLILFYLLRYFDYVKIKRLTATLFVMAFLFTGITGNAFYCYAENIINKSPLMLKFIDVGQGDSTLIAKDGQGVLIDCGGDYYAAQSIAREIEKARVKKLKAVILTHMHTDHINALDYILLYIRPSLLVLPKADTSSRLLTEHCKKYASSLKIAVTTADRDLRIDTLKGVDIRVLTRHILKDETLTSDNDFSNVIKVSGNNTSALIMGDVDETLWRFIKFYKEGIKGDILRVGHHGSLGAVTEDLILRQRPSYAIISVGRDNKYGLPSKDTLNMLDRYGIYRFSTADFGTVTAKITKGKKPVFSLENGKVK